jgi:transposase
MFLPSPQTKVFMATTPTDMRESFRGLIALAEAVLNQDPASGHLFVYIHKRRDMLKILYWDGSGWWISHRQLERGTLQLPPQGAAAESGIGGRNAPAVARRNLDRRRSPQASHGGEDARRCAHLHRARG